MTAVGSKFYLARELKSGRFPGDGKPAAIVRSKHNPRIHATFLCYPDEELENRKRIEGVDTVRKELKLARKRILSGGKMMKPYKPEPEKPKKCRFDATANLDDELSRVPLAHDAARGFEDASAPPSTLKFQGRERTAGSKRRRSPSPSPSPSPERGASRGGRLKTHAREGDGDESDSDSEEDVPPNACSRASTVIRLQGDAVFAPLPYKDPDWRSVAYVAGKAGSGKSKWSADFLLSYKKLFPARPLFGVGKQKLEKDPALAGLGIKQLKIGFFRETRVVGSEGGSGASGGAAPKFDVEAAFGDEGCMILFDDWDSLEGDDKRTIKNAIIDILSVGRKLKVSIVVTSHLLTNYAETRSIINEADFITVFPPCAQHHHLEYFLTNCGIARDMIPSLKQRGPWITLHNTQPTYVLAQQVAQMI